MTFPSKMMRTLHSSVYRHERWRTRECLNLIPSENITSPAVRELLASDLGHRYTARDSFYMGTKYLDKVESACEALARKVFRCKYADVRPLSGHHCNMIVTLSFTKPSDSVLSTSPLDGGYPGISDGGLGRLLGLKNLYFPFDQDRMNIIAEKTIQLISREEPALITFGTSFFLFPHPVAQISKSARESIKVFDGSHVLGLIAGGEFQDPLGEGCDLLMGSTHKSFFGPQGGLILTNNDEIHERLERNIHPGLVDNVHWNRVAALAHSLLEFLRFGHEYAKQVIRNAKHLAKSLSDLGIPVKGASQGYTNSHQVILDQPDHKGKVKVASLLERVGIIVDRGIRLGTSEVTRRGMKETEMELIATLINSVVQHTSSAERISKEVRKLSSEFSTVKYALDIRS